MRFTLRSSAAASAHYRPDIDGLRAIAVLSVILFHAHVPHMDGGFVGVDVFFVISGYLITQILIKDMDAGRFSFVKFYDRRIRRIFPALFTVTLVCSALAIALFPPQQVKEFGASLLAMCIFSSNVYFTRTSAMLGYFGEQSGVRLLLHTWSLAVEEQFYFGFPILLLFLNRFAKRYVRLILLLCLLVSLYASVRGVRTSPIGNFYLVRGRAWELLIGCLLAFRPLPAVRSALLRNLLGLIGLAGIAYAVTTYSSGTLFPGAAALPPCLGAGLLLYSGEAGDSLVKRALGIPPMVFLGAISYSLYLWHWPILALTRYYYPYYFVSAQLCIVPLLLCLVLSVLTFEFVETPFRAKPGQSERRRFLPLYAGFSVSALFALMAFGLTASNGFPQRFSARKAEQMSLNYAHKTEVPNVGPCVNFQLDPKSIKDVDFCQVGSQPQKIMFMGDSHVVQLYPLLERMQASGDFGNRSLLFAMSAGCPLAQDLNRNAPGFHCPAVTSYIVDRAQQGDVDTVVFIFSPFWATGDGLACAAAGDGCGRPLGEKEAWQTFLSDTEANVRLFQKAGKRVVLGVPFPLYNVLLPDMEIRNLGLRPLHLQPVYPREIVDPTYLTDIRALAKKLGVGLYDPRQTLCPEGVCQFDHDGVSLYSDQSHLAYSELDILLPGLAQALQDVPPATPRP